MKGVYVSLTEGEPGSFAVRLDAQGKEIGREPLPAGGRGGGGGGRAGAAAAPGGGRGGGGGAAPAAPGAAPAGAAPAAPTAPPAAGGAPPAAPGGPQAAAPAAAPGGGRAGAPAAGPGGGRGGGAPAPGLPAGVSLPGLARPTGAFRSGQANSVDITLAKASVTLRLNGGSLGGGGGAAEDSAGKYGPIALYVGGTGEARFKDVAYADLTPGRSRRKRSRRTSVCAG